MFVFPFSPFSRALVMPFHDDERRRESEKARTLHVLDVEYGRSILSAGNIELF